MKHSATYPNDQKGKFTVSNNPRILPKVLATLQLPPSLVEKPCP